MPIDALLVILSRWLHVVAACLALGGVVVMRLILPLGLSQIPDAETRKTVFLRCRRAFKMVIHLAILIFILTGTYNAMGNWQAYKNSVPMSHAFLGVHILLALVVFGIALWVLSGKEPPAAHAGAMILNLVLLLAVIAAASTLKYVREHPTKTSPESPPAVAE